MAYYSCACTRDYTEREFQSMDPGSRLCALCDTAVCDHEEHRFTYDDRGELLELFACGYGCRELFVARADAANSIVADREAGRTLAMRPAFARNGHLDEFLRRPA